MPTKDFNEFHITEMNPRQKTTFNNVRTEKPAILTVHNIQLSLISNWDLHRNESQKPITSTKLHKTMTEIYITTSQQLYSPLLKWEYKDLK